MINDMSVQSIDGTFSQRELPEGPITVVIEVAPPHVQLHFEYDFQQVNILPCPPPQIDIVSWLYFASGRDANPLRLKARYTYCHLLFQPPRAPFVCL